MNTYNLKTQLNFDVNHHPYFNVNVPLKIIKPYLLFLKALLPIKSYFNYIQNQQKRDRNSHHITIINPVEYPTIDTKKLGYMVNYPVSIKIIGIGHIKEVDNEVYFLVCENKELNNIRSLFNLPNQDLHITLGFKKHDVFDKAKDRSSLIFPYKEIEN